MIDLILSSPSLGPASLFTRNFRVHAGLPLGLYEGGPRSPVALVYGDISDDTLRDVCEKYAGVIAVPWLEDDDIPEHPSHYEFMTLKAPILARLQAVRRDGFAPLVKTSEGGALVFQHSSDRAVVLLFAADLIKATIRILSGELETSTGKDRFGRHNPPPESVIYAPAVSLHFNLIENMVRHVYRLLGLPLLSIPRWPSAAPLALFLSHDIDVVKKWTPKRIAYELLLGAGDLLRFRGRRLAATMSSVSQAMSGRDPYWHFDEILFLESGNGFTSTWFFAPFGGTYNTRENKIDPVYHRKPSEITAMIRRILEKDCEIALHGTRKAFHDAGDLKRQLHSFENRLGFKIAGVRHHYLMFRHGRTLEAASEVGLKYDATLGFSDRPGFRNGMATPFFLHPTNHPAGSVVEIPLHCMDGVFLHGDDEPETLKRRIIESYLYARAAGGMYSMLVHPGNMDTSEIPELEHFYHSFIPRCKLDGARSMTAGELAEWWNAREQVLRAVEFGDDMWRIRGVRIPPDMEFTISAPDIRLMRFCIEGAGGACDVSGDTLSIRPGAVNPARGITFLRKC